MDVVENICTRLSEQNAAAVNELFELAREIMDEYWISFRLQQKKMKSLQNEGQYLMGSFGPRAFKRGDKPYLEWLHFAPDRYGSRKRSWGQRVNPRKTGGKRSSPFYADDQFKTKAQPWELDMILETEQKLRPIRYALEAAHENATYLRRIAKKSSSDTTHNSDDDNEGN